MGRLREAPFAGPQQVLDDVGRYTHRVALANQRLIALDDGHVRFRYTDDRAQASQTTMTLDATAFIRRVLLHVLPSGFHRIRYDGLLGHRHRREHLARCRHLLGTVARPERVDHGATSADYRDRDEALTGCSLRVCPRCHNGQMRIVERLVGTPARRVHVLQVGADLDLLERARPCPIRFRVCEGSR